MTRTPLPVSPAPMEAVDDIRNNFRESAKRTRFVAFAVLGLAALSTAGATVLSYRTSSHVAERLGQAGTFAAGVAAAFALIAAVVVLIVSGGEESELRHLDRQMDAIVHHAEAENAFALEKNVRAFDAVLALRRISEALGRICEVIVDEASAAAEKCSLDSPQRAKTWHAFTSLVAVVADAEEKGVLVALRGRKMDLETYFPADASWYPIEISVEWLLLNLVADAAADLRGNTTEVGQRWLSTADVAVRSTSLAPALLFRHKAAPSHQVAAVQLLQEELDGLSVEQILAMWDIAFPAPPRGSEV